MKVLTGRASATFIATHFPRAAPLPPDVLEVTHLSHDAAGVQSAVFEASFADGSRRSGATDSGGQLTLADVPPGTVQLRFKPDARAYAAKAVETDSSHKPSLKPADWDAPAVRHAGNA